MQFTRHRRIFPAAIRRTNQTHITGKLDALDADAPDAFYQLLFWTVCKPQVWSKYAQQHQFYGYG